MFVLKRCFIFTLGFHEDVVLRRLNEEGARRGEEILVVSGPENPGVRRAFESLRNYALKVGYSEPRIIHVDPSEPHKALVEIAEFLSGCRGCRVVAEFGGGLRCVGYLTLLALLALGVEFNLHVRIEGSDTDVKVPWEVVEPIAKELRNLDYKIMSVLARTGGCSEKEVAEEAGIGEKTVRNRLAELRRRGLVEKKGRSEPKLTPWGEAIVKLEAERRRARERESRLKSL